MANKRMFALDVVDTDLFLEMPTSSQALYFQLGMRADDDGFVASPKKIAKISNCGEDDLRILASKGYIIPFDSGVVVVTHWGVNNNKIKGDRYKQTIYVKEKDMLRQDRGVYSRVDSEMVPQCFQVGTDTEPEKIQSGKITEPQIRLDKNNNICSPEAVERASEDGKNPDEGIKNPDEKVKNFEKIYAIYPKKRGRTKAFGKYCSWLKGRSVNGQRIKLTNKQMYLAVYAYVEQQKENGTELEYYKNFDTLMGNQLLDYVEERDE